MIPIIIAFSKREIGEKVRNILVRNGFTVTAVCVTGAQVLRAAGEEDRGIIISGLRYPDMICHDIRKNLPDYTMVVLSDQVHWEEYGAEGVIWLPMPLTVYDLLTTVEDVLSDQMGRAVRRQTRSKRSRQEESLISRAKSYLIKHKSMTEEEAHRYLQKCSMDSGSNLVDTAYMLLRMSGQL
ncbi:MAG: ANTAR domain-containing protein [Eubacterium sp.]|nr:ANTAR domain-containing protein [Eubacterium sp.]